ncbi:DUF1735 domain-containing protein [Bacteroides faecium]|uniref:DUF1735 domain-containing protein n=1 Tax=Bacteroides faecium TaxID=2715212 RepID=A0A6H0KJ38_9BACE|nr:DUF1735 domain-containing protein [Bacteroides faecium]QIU93295.1 DUF1735 domain-containing protein [Bacteroides faecium]
MKKQLLYISLASMLLTMSACENDGKNDFLSDFSTTMYFTNSGVQELGCLKIGEPADYNVYVYKAGSDLSAVSDATATLLTEEELQEYNQANGTQYKLLPENCYEAQKRVDLQFASSELVHAFPVEFDADKIDALDKSVEYVLPYNLTSSKPVNENKNIVLIKPVVVMPTIGFNNPDMEVVTVSPSDPKQVVIQKVLSVPFQNRWTFDCTLAVDESAIEKYNRENDTDYKLLPADQYKYDKAISFKAGSNEAIVKVTINRTEELVCGNYMLPLKLVSCTHPHIVAEDSKSVAAVGYCYTLPKIPLSIEMLSANATTTDGKGLPGLIDGVGNGMHYHTDWNGKYVDETYRHYIDIHFKAPIQRMMLEYWTRFNNATLAPQRVVLWTSNDGVTWAQWQVLEGNLPTTKNTKYQSTFFKSEQPFSYLRFSVTKNSAGEVGSAVKKDGCFSIDDLIIYGQ